MSIAEKSSVALAEGVNTDVYTCQNAATNVIVFGHGLGLSANKDSWSRLLKSIVVEQRHRYVAYDARGHAGSSGWESTAASHPLQFQWEALSQDMMTIVNNVENPPPKFVATGHSMGASTALLCAMNNPDKVIALILFKPPTAWQSRIDRTSLMQQNADFYHENRPESSFHHVLRGTIASQLPDGTVDEQRYSSIRCPVLILCTEGDEVHPVSTSLELVRLIPHAQLHIAASDEEGEKKWGNVIQTFLSLCLS